jgi:hypothetical protein
MVTANDFLYHYASAGQPYGERVKNTLIVRGVATTLNITAEQPLDWKLPQ